jgi:hypothetical protein
MGGGPARVRRPAVFVCGLAADVVETQAKAHRRAGGGDACSASGKAGHELGKSYVEGVTGREADVHKQESHRQRPGRRSADGVRLRRTSTV